MQSLNHFVLYSRNYCHLCGDMEAALRKLSSSYEFTLDIVDIDQDQDLILLYDELVPVLFGKRHDKVALKLCHYFLDEIAVRNFLQGMNTDFESNSLLQ
jgi:Glutaredoxin-like domain (DUF836)